MAAPEHWLVANPSAEVDQPEGDDQSESVWASPAGLSWHRITTLVRDQLEMGHGGIGLRSATNFAGPLAPLEGTVLTGFGLHQDPGYVATLRQYVLTAVGDVTWTSNILEESSPTAAGIDEPLLEAVAHATDEQKGQIWRILGVVEDVHIARRLIHPNPQPVSSDWLDEVLSARARPTPISLADWYEDETA